MKLNDQNILIIGGAGYIGSHTNLELKRRGYKTVVFDNLSLGHKEFIKNDNFRQGDLNNISDIKKVFEQYNIKAVVHFAALSKVGESMENPEMYYYGNVVNTLNLLNVMKEYDVQKIIFSSTAAVYGEPDIIPINESSKINPINPYGASKVMIENILSDYDKSYNIKFVSLRYFNACGADKLAQIGEWHTPETHLIPLVLDVAINKRESIKIFGVDYDTEDGTCIRDYIHVTDLAEAHILALEYLFNGNESDIFNLGNAKGYSVKEIINTVEKVTKRDITKIEVNRREGDPAVLVANASKANEVLKWKPKLNLDDIIQSAWHWHVKLHQEYLKDHDD